MEFLDPSLDPNAASDDRDEADERRRVLERTAALLVGADPVGTVGRTLESHVFSL